MDIAARVAAHGLNRNEMLIDATIQANVQSVREQKFLGCFQSRLLFRFHLMGEWLLWEHLHPVVVVRQPPVDLVGMDN